MERSIRLVVHIDFPALDAFNEYLNTQTNQQQEIDELEVKVKELTETLASSSENLQKEV